MTTKTTPNNDWASHGGTKTQTFEGGKQTKEVHTTSGGKTHEHEVGHGTFGPYAGKRK